MKVRLQSDRARGGILELAGEVVEVDAAEGKRLIAYGEAEPVNRSESIQQATRQASRNAAGRTSKQARKGKQ